MAQDESGGGDVVCLARLGVKSADIVILYDGGAIYPRTVFLPVSQSKDPAKYFADSINDVLSYYRFKLHLPDVDRMYLTGVVNDDVRQKIEEMVDVDLELWDPLAQVHIAGRSLQRKLDGADMAVRAGVAVAMGLGVGSGGEKPRMNANEH